MDVLVDLVNIPNKHQVKVEVVEVEDSPVEDEKEDKEECQDDPIQNFDSKFEPHVNWDEVNMGMFFRMDEGGMRNFLSLVKWLFSEVKELNF